MLLPFPLSEKGETSVRDSAVEASEVVDNVDCGTANGEHHALHA